MNVCNKSTTRTQSLCATQASPSSTFSVRLLEITRFHAPRQHLESPSYIDPPGEGEPPNTTPTSLAVLHLIRRWLRREGAA